MITVDWDNNEQTAIREDFSGELLFHEMDKAQQDIIELLDSVPRPVVVLMVLGADLRFTQDVISRFPRWSRAPMMSHPNLGGIVIVGARGLTATLVDIFIRVYRAQTVQISLAPTLYDARQKIAACIG